MPGPKTLGFTDCRVVGVLVLGGGWEDHACPPDGYACCPPALGSPWHPETHSPAADREGRDPKGREVNEQR